MRPVVLALSVLACGQENEINRVLSPPEVSITVPEPGQRVRKGDAVTFDGIVLDAFDSVDRMTIEWILDETQVFTSSSRVVDENRVTLDLDLTDLELGEHLVQLHAVDSDAMEGLTGVPFVVDGAISAPMVTIEAPSSGAFFAPAEEVTFRGSATDNNTLPDELVFTWRSSLDGTLSGAISSGGQSVLFHGGLRPGVHAITLEATDRDGEVGYDTIEVSIGETTDQAEPGDLVFSELMIDPEVVEDELGEWVELYNTSGLAIDVGGYTFRDDDFDVFELEGPLLVAPHDTIVLCANVDERLNGGVPCDGPFQRKTSGALALGNNSDEVILERPDGVVIDEVVYDGDWFRTGIAIGVDPSKLDSANNDTEADWCDQTTVVSGGGEPGTPGRPNDPC